jgi:sterol desaturase/sphingolipid hydroxylase (fatty acid hydroxylase superfamily)
MAESEGPALAGAVVRELVTFALSPFDLGGVGARLHPASFLVFVAVGIGLYAAARRRGETASGSALGFMFPRAIYFSRSSLVDLKVYVASCFIVFDRIGIRILSTSAVAAFVSAALIGVFGEASAEPLQGWRLALCFLCVALAYDFGGYWLHRMSHEVGVLWPFHKVHHSAEVLTPLTVARVHPVYGFVTSLFIPLTVGPVLGVVYALVGEQDAMAITAVGGAYFVFNLAGSNLRHSHLWLSYGPVVSRVLVSPAMHQIHHSMDARHWNKNYAEIFALWDWMFGTLYVPKERETLAFGLGRDETGATIQPHPTLKAALVGPFLEAGAAAAVMIRARLGRVDAPSVDEVATREGTETR